MRELEQGSWWNAGMRDVAVLLLNLVSLPSSGMMLDVGCGSGQSMEWFARLYPGWRTVGLDVAPEGLASARTKRLAVMRASALDLPVRPNSIDLVITLDVLQHVPLRGGDTKALSEIVRVLKPGGYAFIRTNAQALPYTADDPVFNFHKYSPHELRNKLSHAGLRIIRLSRLNAVLGLTEIPRELRARTQEHSYLGILAEKGSTQGVAYRLKRHWLRFEGRVVRSGLSWPFGRTLVALCQRDR